MLQCYENLHFSISLLPELVDSNSGDEPKSV